LLHVISGMFCSSNAMFFPKSRSHTSEYLSVQSGRSEHFSSFFTPSLHALQLPGTLASFNSE
jgi:hypothetical protein